MIVLQPMNIVQAAADLIHSPVFKKFPDVTVALSEGGIGWIPYFLERLDHSYRVHKAWTGADFGSKMPSEVFMEHVVLCFISDAVGARWPATSASTASRSRSTTRTPTRRGRARPSG